MINKSEQVRNLLKQNKIYEAMRIGKTFRKGNKTLINDIQRGWDASQNPSFYKQLGMNPESLYKKGIESLRSLVLNIREV